MTAYRSNECVVQFIEPRQQGSEMREEERQTSQDDSNHESTSWRPDLSMKAVSWMKRKEKQD